MRRFIGSSILFAISITATPAAGQTLRPTPPPTVTAENEPWFVARAPLMFGGTLYFPAGAQVHFNQNEMVGAGFYGAVPVYVRTTLEPRSVVFVPLSGGLMQPYERRRSGELAGTVGSSAPSFPVENAAEAEGTDWRMLRAAGPPIAGVAAPLGAPAPTYAPPAAPPVAPPPPARPVATAGTADRIPTGPLASASRPEGLNNVFVTYDSRRWFNSGAAVPFDTAAYRRIGTHGDVPVYSRADAPETIFIPVSAAASDLVVPYSTARGR